MKASSWAVSGLLLLTLLYPAFSCLIGAAVYDPVPPSRASPVTFTNVSLEAGLSGYRGNFFSWGDYDNDGYQDLLVDGKLLFRNSGPPDHTFTDVTQRARIGGQVNSGVFADHDNDGWLDIFCGGGSGSSDHPTHPDILWRNMGDGTFRDVTFEAGNLSDTFPTVAGAWSDVDRDGYVDLYMVNYENGTYQGYRDHFWLNNGDGTFSNWTVMSGMSEGGHPYQGRGASFADFDNDMWPDLYVSNYRIMPNYLYRNVYGEMEEAAAELGVDGHESHHPVTREGPYYGHSVGACWGDLDNDGDLDLWVTNLAHKDPWRGPICDDSYLFENLGEEGGWAFVDRREGSGIPVKSIPGAIGGGDELFVSCAMADYDNDGDLDLFLPQIYGDISYAHSQLYRNDGGFRFTDVTDETGLKVWNTYGSAWCDYDNDGWIDLVTGGGNWDPESGSTVHSSIHLFRNNGGSSTSENSFLKVTLIGRESNSAAIGARLTVDIDDDRDGTIDRSMIREISAGSGAHGQQDAMVQHIGLGNVEGSIELKVLWPMGRESTLTDVEKGSHIRLFEPDEPIDYDIEILEHSFSDGTLTLTAEISNPSDHTLREYWVLALVERYGLKAMSSVSGEKIAPGSSTVVSIDIVEEDRPFETDDLVSVFITGAYPRPGSLVHDSFRMGSEGPPMAILTGPERGVVGESMVFSGEGSYSPSGSILSYRFDLGDGTETTWQSMPTVAHSYSSPGEYEVSLEVMDAGGTMSENESILSIQIVREENMPTAVISSIDPSEAVQGDMVRFDGYGIPGPERGIIAYEWRSNIDGMLSRRSSFEADDLSAGSHVIEFRVRDTSGIWSDPDTGTMTVLEPEREELWVSWDRSVSLDNLTGPVLLKGSSGPVGTVNVVEVRKGLGPWMTAWSAPDWEYLLDPSGSEPGPEHFVEVRSSDRRGIYSEVLRISFTVEEGYETPEYRTSGGERETIAAPIWIAALAILLGSIVSFGYVYLIVRKRTGNGVVIGERVHRTEAEDDP
ncbi:MAG: FG-GAP-like repeat-containing protein [Candidatus Thermoplasmatota archaeon]|nr:FG-GAP-like repeat-containing protein [Candidatus Thermoplasmatota archaeon]